MIVLTCDPGIDLAAAAAFDTARIVRPGTLDGAAVAYLEMHSQRTRATDPMPARVQLLYEWMRSVIEVEGATRLVIEVPHSAGTYRGKQSRQASKSSINADALAKLERAIAALQLGASSAGVEVIEIPARYPAIWTKKEARHESLRAAMAAAGRADFTSLGRRTNADERDAAFLGLYYLACRPAAAAPMDR